jgi:hypothetical protein
MLNGPRFEIHHAFNIDDAMQDGRHILCPQRSSRIVMELAESSVAIWCAGREKVSIRTRLVDGASKGR